GVVEEHDLETIFWGWCGRFPSLSSFDRFFWQEEPLWRLIFEAGEAGLRIFMKGDHSITSIEIG
ncbi:hypothetical protein ABQG64_05235, partial [Escherichia coli]